MIEHAIDYSNPQSLGSRLRARRLRAFLELIGQSRRRASRVRILDIGGTAEYWRVVPDKAFLASGVSITVINLPDVTMGVDDDVFQYVVGDGCSLEAYDDNSFDVVHSNSVLEHVGDWTRMTAFAREVRRLAPAYFVQTPNFWFPIEPHYLRPCVHWIPEPLRARLLLTTSVGQYPRAASMDEAMRLVQGNRLLTRPMLSSLFPDAHILTERVAFLPKSLMAIRDFE